MQYYLLNPTWVDKELEITADEAIEQIESIRKERGIDVGDLLQLMVGGSKQYLQAKEVKEKVIRFIQY